jgi:hypothetical protein
MALLAAKSTYDMTQNEALEYKVKMLPYDMQIFINRHTSILGMKVYPIQDLPNYKITIQGCSIEWEGAGVYFLIYRGKVVYIGKSTNVKRRISQHLLTNKVFDNVSVHHVKYEDLTGLEGIYINALKPEHNKVIPALGEDISFVDSFFITTGDWINRKLTNQ